MDVGNVAAAGAALAQATVRNAISLYVLKAARQQDQQVLALLEQVTEATASTPADNRLDVRA